MACDPIHQSCPPGASGLPADGEPAAAEALSSSSEVGGSSFVAGPVPDEALAALTSPTRVDEARTRVRTALLRAGFVTRQGDRFFLNPTALVSWSDLSRMIRTATEAGGLDAFRNELADLEIPKPPQTQGTSASPWQFLWNLRSAGTPEADFLDRGGVYNDAFNFVIPVQLMLQRVAGELQMTDEDTDKIAELMVTSLQNAQAASDTFAVESDSFRESYARAFAKARGADDPILIDGKVLDREVLAEVRAFLNREPGSDLRDVTNAELALAIRRRLDENQAAAPVRLLISSPFMEAARQWARKHPKSIDHNPRQWRLFSTMVDRLLSGYASLDEVPSVIDVDDLMRRSLCAEIGIYPEASEMDSLFNPLEDAFPVFVEDFQVYLRESGETFEALKRESEEAYKAAVAQQDQKREAIRRGRVEKAVHDYLDEWRAGSRGEVSTLDFYAEIRQRASRQKQGWQRVSDHSVRGYFRGLIEPILIAQAPTLLGRKSSPAMTDRAVVGATESVTQEWLRGFNHPITREALLRRIVGRAKQLWGGEISLSTVMAREERFIIPLVREQAPSMVLDERYTAAEVDPAEDDMVDDWYESQEPAGFQRLPVKKPLPGAIDYRKWWRRKSRVSHGENPRDRHTREDLLDHLRERGDAESLRSTLAPREVEVEVVPLVEGARRLLP